VSVTHTHTHLMHWHGDWLNKQLSVVWGNLTSIILLPLSQICTWRTVPREQATLHMLTHTHTLTHIHKWIIRWPFIRVCSKPVSWWFIMCWCSGFSFLNCPKFIHLFCFLYHYFLFIFTLILKILFTDHNPYPCDRVSVLHTLSGINVLSM